MSEPGKVPKGFEATQFYAAVSPEQTEANLKKGRGTKDQVQPSRMLTDMRHVMRTEGSLPEKPDSPEQMALRILKQENLKEFVGQLRQMEQAHSAQKHAMRKARLEARAQGAEVADGPVEDERSVVVMDRLKGMIERATRNG